MDNKKIKRSWMDMSFSPEQEASMTQKDCLKEILSDLLDTKFKEYLKPITKEVKELQDKVKVMEDSHKRDIYEIKQENQKLKDDLRRLETFQRKNNVRFYGIPEHSGEDLDKMMVTVLNKTLGGDASLNLHTFERIHRLGPFVKGKTRPVIARFANYKDKVSVLKARMPLSRVDKISVSDDVPLEVEQNRRKMYPVFAAIKSNLSKEEAARLFLREDKLVFRGVSYGLKDLKNLPSDVDLNSLFTPTKNNITAFFSRYSKLSNHFPCSFDVQGQRYTTMEQFLFVSLAKLFKDENLQHDILQCKDPVRIKSLGKKIHNFDKTRWRENIEGILYSGLMEKFSQNSDLKASLLNTGSTTLVEANRLDSEYGIGLSLADHRLWDPESWKAENLMGKALMAVRDSLRKVDTE